MTVTNVVAIDLIYFTSALTMNKRLTIIPLCLLALTCTEVPTVLPVIAAPQTRTIAASPTSPEAISRQITVRVLVGDRRSSGTIISRRGSRYTILTNAHVTNKGNNYRITTPDGKTYPAKCAQALKQGVCTAGQSNDLALLEFTSSQTYTVPTWGDSRSLTPGETIYSAGFPFDVRDLKTSMGKVNIQTNKPLQGGYQIGFNVTTEPGMSGGSLLNSKGQLIGIIGFSSYPILNDGYQYQDGSQPANGEIAQWRKSSFAIPVATLAQLDSQYATLLPSNGSTAVTSVARTKYTGVVKKVDDIAQQITVRIEDNNGNNGSGVIVAKQGDIYSVVTAAHVVQDIKKDNGRNILRDKIATVIVTPTGERVTLRNGEIDVANPNLDIAVVKFRSAQNYQVADIAKYEFNENDWVFVSGFPGKDSTKRRKLTIGLLQERYWTDFKVKDRESLTRGFNLIYTNLSLPGMSGGAVLDRQGRLVGINTGAENERADEEINFGYALGIPMATILEVTSQGQIPTARLRVANTPTPDSIQSENEEIRRIQLSAVAKPSQTATATEWLDYGNLLWRGQKHQEAVTAFETAIKLLERNSEISQREQKQRIAYYGLGLAWLENHSQQNKQDLQASVVAFQQAVKIDPNFYPSWRYLGWSLYRLNRYNEALTAYQKAISKVQSDFVLYEEIGDVLRHLKRYPEAITAYNRAIKLQPSHLWAYNNRGLTYLEQKQYPQAMADFNYAIKLNPQFVMGYSNRGLIYSGQERYPQAMAEYNKAIDLDPKWGGAYLNRGGLYYKQEQYAQAIKDYTQALKLNVYTVEIGSHETNIYRNRGFAYRDLKQYTLAIADFNQLIRLNPQSAIGYNDRGNVYKEMEQYSQAIADYTQAIKLDSQDVVVYHNRGLIYGKMKQYSQAIADYTQAIKLNSQDVVAYSGRGLIYKDLKQYSQAIEEFSQIIKISSLDLHMSAAAYSNRGVVYKDMKQYPQAKADLTKAAELWRGLNVPVGYQFVMNILQELPQK
jgi:tetratricopeptide (TPR) repeat protein/S1-C subfamily serine protease